MSIQVEKKHPIYHPLKVAIITILAFGIIAIFLRFRADDNSEAPQISATNSFSTFGFVPVVELAVDGELESDWSLALSKATGGARETSVDFGRIDILTDSYAIEIDRIEKWKEGVGQSLQYAEETGRLPLLALFTEADLDEGKIQYIDSFCQKKGIKLVILKRKKG